MNKHAFTSIAFVLLLLCSTARAEGSKDLTPDSLTSSISASSKNNNYVGFLQHDDNQTNAPRSFGFLKPSSNAFFTKDHRLKVHLEPGDTLFFGVRRIPTNSGGDQGNLTITLQVELPIFGNFTLKSVTLQRDTSSIKDATLLAQKGVINSKAECSIGPLYYTSGSTLDFNRPVGGYNAETLINTYGIELDVWFEFTQPSSATQKCWYDLWDFTVRNNGEKKGRLYSKLWSFSTGANGNRLAKDFILYPAIPSDDVPPRYFIQSVNLGGMRPYGFSFLANDSGTAVNGNYKERRKSIDSFAIYPEFDVFINDPDTIIKPSAEAGVFFTYADRILCVQNNKKVVINYYVDKPAVLLFFINFNGLPDYQPNSTDVLVESVAPGEGNYNLYWNAKKGDGSAVADGTTISLTLSALFYPSHFPLWDVENNDVGLLVQNVRPSSSSESLKVFWDDTNLDSATYPSFEPRLNLLGIDASTARTHKWSGGDGDEVNVNTYYYGDVVDTTFDAIISFDCDADGDGVDNGADLDDDNDGILNVDEMYGTDPYGDSDNDSIPNFMDIDYVHPVYGIFVDRNIDLVNDIFDTDMDGIPNFQDLDSDGDGILDMIEADNPEGAPAITTTAKNFDYGTISNSAGISTVGTNGVPDDAETSADNGVSRYNLADSDGDGIPNFLDIDSDNDGILDLTEVLSSNSTNLPMGVDVDNDGIDDRYDPQCNGTPAECASFLSGTALIPVNTDNTGMPDYLDLDSDEDNLPDYADNADENSNGYSSDDLNNRALAVNAAQGSVIYPQLDLDGNGVLDYLMLFPGTERAYFLTAGNPVFSDINKNGLVDLYDSLMGGSLLTPADFNTNGVPDWRDTLSANPLPVEWLSFSGSWTPAGSLLEWITASEENNAGFLIKRSYDGEVWESINFIDGYGTTQHQQKYNYVDQQAPNIDMIFYKLIQQDYDGSKSHSSVVIIRRGSNLGAERLWVYPNPVTHGTCSIYGADDATVATVLNTQGQIVMSDLLQTVPSGAVQLDVSVLAPGIYYIRVYGYEEQLLKIVKL